MLLARVFFNAYLAGQINEMENLTAEQIQHFVAPHVPTSELLLAKVLGKVGAVFPSSTCSPSIGWANTRAGCSGR